MIGGGIVFIDDKARGLHEGYLVTPFTKRSWCWVSMFAGAIKGMMAGTTITIIGGLIAGIERIWDPVRLLYLLLVVGSASLAMISFMFLVMVRVNDPLVPRAIFGVLNTLLFFPSGAIYPVEGFPLWLRAISHVDPFTYVVHALKNLLLKNTGFVGIYSDVGILLGFSAMLICGMHSSFQAPNLKRTGDAIDATGRKRGTKVEDAALHRERRFLGHFDLPFDVVVRFPPASGEAHRRTFHGCGGGR